MPDNGSEWAVFAGKGSLPKAVINELGTPKIICFEGENDPEIKADLITRFGRVGEIVNFLKLNNIKKIVFAGAMQRPDLKSLTPDAEGAKLMAKIMASAFFGKGFGDDKLLTTVTAYLEEKGFEIVAVQEVLKNIMAPKGLLGSVEPTVEQSDDIKIGLDVLKEMGRLDIGQAVIVENAVVLAVEAVEGTAKMIERTGALKKAYGGVLVKCKKPTQTEKADMPTIGPETVKQISAAGIAGIAFQAGQVFILEKDLMIEEANKAGVFLLGV